MRLRAPGRRGEIVRAAGLWILVGALLICQLPASSGAPPRPLALPAPWRMLDLWEYGRPAHLTRWTSVAGGHRLEVASDENVSMCPSGGRLWLLLRKGGSGSRPVTETLLRVDTRRGSVTERYAIPPGAVPSVLSCPGPYLLGPSVVVGPIGRAGFDKSPRFEYPGGGSVIPTLGADGVLGLIVPGDTGDTIEAVPLGSQEPIASARCPHPACDACLFPVIHAGADEVLAACGSGFPASLVAAVSYADANPERTWSLKSNATAGPYSCGAFFALAGFDMNREVAIYNGGRKVVAWLEAPDGYQFGSMRCAGGKLLAILARTGNGFFSFSDGFHIRNSELAAYSVAPPKPDPLWIIKAPTGMAFQIAVDEQTGTVFLLDPHGDLYYAQMPTVPVAKRQHDMADRRARAGANLR